MEIDDMLTDVEIVTVSHICADISKYVCMQVYYVLKGEERAEVLRICENAPQSCLCSLTKC